MKRLVIGLLAASLCFALASCTSSKAEESQQEEESSAQQEEAAGAQQGEADIQATGGLDLKADSENIAYATLSPSQVLDIYLPANPSGEDALLVLVHGGAFKFGNQKAAIFEGVVKRAQQIGYVVASVDYRKSAEATFPASVSDVKAAVRFLKANATTYGIDSGRIAIWGESAGAYLALMTALTADTQELDGDVTDNAEQSSAVNALVSFYAPVDFYTLNAQKTALGIDDPTNCAFEAEYLGQPLTADEETTRKTWWGTYADEQELDVQVWIQAGTADDNVPYTQSQDFARELAQLIGEEAVHFALIDGAKHMDAAFYTDENLSQVFAFLDAALN